MLDFYLTCPGLHEAPKDMKLAVSAAVCYELPYSVLPSAKRLLFSLPKNIV